jgi:hypothetical protein
MRTFLAIITPALLLAAVPATAQPLGPRLPVAGKMTEVLTLGTMHLSESPTFTAVMLDPLLERLARFRPTIITVESVPGEQCDMMRRSPRYTDAVSSYCWDPAPAQKLAGLTQQQAETEIGAILKGWARPGAASPGPSDRRRAALNPPPPTSSGFALIPRSAKPPMAWTRP